MDDKLPVDPNLMFICRTCDSYLSARERGLDTCGVVGCGGPRKGGVFAKYKGVLSRDIKRKYCFQCGADAERLMKVEGQGVLGICKKCEENFSKLP
jgi:hypothetical protein